MKSCFKHSDSRFLIKASKSLRKLLFVCSWVRCFSSFIHSFKISLRVSTTKFYASNVCSCSNFLNQFAFLLTFCNKASLIPFVQTPTDCELVIGWLGSICLIDSNVVIFYMNIVKGGWKLFQTG